MIGILTLMNEGIHMWNTVGRSPEPHFTYGGLKTGIFKLRFEPWPLTPECPLCGHCSLVMADCLDLKSGLDTQFSDPGEVI